MFFYVSLCFSMFFYVFLCLLMFFKDFYKDPQPLFIKILNININNHHHRSPSADTTPHTTPASLVMVKTSGTSNWTKVETDHLLSIIEDILPLQPAEWEEVNSMSNTPRLIVPLALSSASSTCSIVQRSRWGTHTFTLLRNKGIS